MRTDAAAMLLADYRGVGAPDLVCVSDRGEGRYIGTFIFARLTRVALRREDAVEELRQLPLSAPSWRCPSDTY